MSPERAQSIWDARHPFGELSMTDAERMAVRKVWSGMPGHTCLADALLRIARGEAVAVLDAVLHSRCRPARCTAAAARALSSCTVHVRP